MHRLGTTCLALAVAAVPLLAIPSAPAAAAKPTVTARVVDATLDEGDTLTVKGKATGSAARKTQLQEKSSGRWSASSPKTSLAANDSYVLNVVAKRGEHTYRVVSLRRDGTVLAHSGAFAQVVRWTPGLTVTSVPGWDGQGRSLTLNGTTSGSVPAVELRRRLGPDGAWSTVDTVAPDVEGTFGFTRHDVGAAQFKVVAPGDTVRRAVSSQVFTNPGTPFTLTPGNGVTVSGLRVEDDAARVDLALTSLAEVSLAGIPQDGGEWTATVTGPGGTVGTFTEEDPVLRLTPTSKTGYSVRLEVSSGDTWTLWASTPAALVSGQSVALVPGQVAERTFSPPQDQGVSITDDAGGAVTRTMRDSEGSTPTFLEHDTRADPSTPSVHILEDGHTYRYRLAAKTLAPLTLTVTVVTSTQVVDATLDTKSTFAAPPTGGFALVRLPLIEGDEYTQQWSSSTGDPEKYLSWKYEEHGVGVTYGSYMLPAGQGFVGLTEAFATGVRWFVVAASPTQPSTVSFKPERLQRQVVTIDSDLTPVSAADGRWVLATFHGTEGDLVAVDLRDADPDTPYQWGFARLFAEVGSPWHDDVLPTQTGFPDSAWRLPSTGDYTVVVHGVGPGALRVLRVRETSFAVDGQPHSLAVDLPGRSLMQSTSATPGASVTLSATWDENGDPPDFFCEALGGHPGPGPHPHLAGLSPGGTINGPTQTITVPESGEFLVYCKGFPDLDVSLTQTYVD